MAVGVAAAGVGAQDHLVVVGRAAAVEVRLGLALAVLGVALLGGLVPQVGRARCAGDGIRAVLGVLLAAVVVEQVRLVASMAYPALQRQGKTR